MSNLGNFLIIVPGVGAAAEAKRLFGAGLGSALAIRPQPPDDTFESDWALAASFSRRNGNNIPITSDVSTGNWLIALGTWFHSTGHASGSESWLLRRYLEIDIRRLARELEGFFVLIFGNAGTREVTVLTDIIGSYHCYSRKFEDAVALSGSSLLLACLESCKPDWIGCQEFLSTGIIYEDRTCYQEVRKLGPAGIFTFAGGAEKTARRYWQAGDLKPESLKGEAAVDALWDRLTYSVKRIYGVCANPVCDLTGGYDSRAIVAAFVENGARYATVVSGPPDSADVLISRSLAQMLDVPHLHNEKRRQISFEQIQTALSLTDGEYNVIEYAGIAGIHQKLSKQFDMSINGSFGEVARGYWWELLFPRIGAHRHLDERMVAMRRYAAQSCDLSLIPEEYRLNPADHFTNVIERTNAGLSHFPNTFQMDHAYLMMRMQRWQGRIASSTNRIWPCLSPFMFRSVLETMLQTFSLLRWRSLLIRKMLAKFSPRLAGRPLEHGFPAQPATLKNFYRFSPLIPYFTGKVGRKLGLRAGAVHGDDFRSPAQLRHNEQIREILNPANMKLGSWLDPVQLKSFLKRSEEAGFPFGDQWARLLTLEYALRFISLTQQSSTD